MSTRCQVTVQQHGIGWDQKVTMYRHCDGYPSSILPSLAKAFKMLDADREQVCHICQGTGGRAEPPALGPGPVSCNGCHGTGRKMAEGAWQAGRAGKAASAIIAEGYQKASKDHGCYVAYEPEAGHALHGDIEYYYVVTITHTRNGDRAERPVWSVQVFAPLETFWDTATPENMRLVVEGDVRALAKRAEKIS